MGVWVLEVWGAVVFLPWFYDSLLQGGRQVLHGLLACGGWFQVPWQPVNLESLLERGMLQAG